MSTGVSAVLQELNRLRRHLRELRQEIERLPQLLKARQARLARQEQEARDAQEQLKRLKVRLHEQEVTLKSTHQMIAKWEKQLDTIANKKEYDALQAEIAHA